MESTTQLHPLELLRNVSSVTHHMALLAKMQGARVRGLVVNKKWVWRYNPQRCSSPRYQW